MAASRSLADPGGRRAAHCRLDRGAAWGRPELRPGHADSAGPLANSGACAPSRASMRETAA